MAAAELRPEGPAAVAGGQRAVVGSQRQRPHAVSRRAEPDGDQPVVDLGAGRRVLQLSLKRDECGAGDAWTRATVGQPEEHAAADGVGAEPASGTGAAASTASRRCERSTPQQTVIVQPPAQTIIIQPAQPDVVYVPTYNPTVVYGAPVAVYPGYSTGAMVATSLLSFGVGIAVGAAISGGGGCCGWGWNSWGCGWHNNTVVYNHNTYISNSNTFVNRNNYYNRNNVNANNFNRNNVNANNFNRNNVNANNINRNNLQQQQPRPTTSRAAATPSPTSTRSWTHAYRTARISNLGRTRQNLAERTAEPRPAGQIQPESRPAKLGRAESAEPGPEPEPCRQ